MKINKNKIDEVVSNSIKHLNEIIDVNTIIGKAMNIENTVIIPITKVTLCLLAGGGEYGKISMFNNGNNLPFSAGNGTVVSIKPSGFLIKDGNDNFKLLSVGNNNCEVLINKLTDLYSKLTREDGV